DGDPWAGEQARGVCASRYGGGDHPSFDGYGGAADYGSVGIRYFDVELARSGELEVVSNRAAAGDIDCGAAREIPRGSRRDGLADCGYIVQRMDAATVGCG